MEMNDDELFKIVAKINEIFYEKVYEDEWLVQIFGAVDIELISSQQTDFIVGALGGPKKYCGRSPKDAHPHIFIQEDMWLLRENYLMEAFKEVNAPDWMIAKWIGIDNAFKKAILKKNPSDCVGRYKTEELIIIPNPQDHKKSA
jgi:hemoglobin